MNRRQFLGGAAALLGVNGFQPAKAWFPHGVATGALALVPPGNSWTGAPGSGVPGAVALSANGTYNSHAYTAGQPLYATHQMAIDIGSVTPNAMPPLRWWQSSQLRSSGPTLVGVLADAGGLLGSGYKGISKVTFNVEGTPQDAYLSAQTITDGAGVAHLAPGYFINVDCATAAAKGYSKAAIRVYATAYPNDPTISPRTIGPLTIHPRNPDATTGSVYDFDVTVNPSGGSTGSASLQTGNFTTLASALQAMSDALNSHGRECGCVTITSNAGDVSGHAGKYEWGYPAAWGFPWSYGLSRVTTSSGVNVTLVRGTTFDPYNATATNPGVPGNNTLPNRNWFMFSYVNNLEFYGSGITIDIWNFNNILSQNNAGSEPRNLHPVDGSQLWTGSFLFNGCKIVNSQGVVQQTYWNSAPYPGLGVIEVNNAHPVVAWTLGCQITGVYQPGFGTFSAFNRVNDCLSTSYDNPTFVFGEYYANATLANESWYTRTGSYGQWVGCTITYNGTGTNPQIVFTYNAATLALVVNGSPAHTFQLQSPWSYLGDGSSTFTKWSQIVSYINNAANGLTDWSATQTGTDGDAFSAYNMRDYELGNNTYTLTAGTPQPLHSRFNIHSEWIHWINGGPFENAIIWNCTVFNCGWGTSFIDMENNGANFRDVSIKNITYDTKGGGNGSNGSNPTGFHVCCENWTLEETVLINRGGTAVYDNYSSVSQIVCTAMSLYQGSYGTSGGLITPTNCLAGQSPPSGNGNVVLSGSGSQGSLTDSDWLALYPNRASGNWLPSGTIGSHLFAKANPYDAEMTVRASSDAAGAWSVNAAAPTWPF